MPKRACDTCHTIKIKCEGGLPCHRCVRLGKTCLVSPPLRQRDRIAELEAKLEEATKLLRLHQVQDLPPTLGLPGAEAVGLQASANNGRKRRRGPGDEVGVGPLDLDTTSAPLQIDHIVSPRAQKQLLHRYREVIETVFPFPIAGTYESLRNESPVLLQTLIFAASQGNLPCEVQSQLTSAVMNLFTPERCGEARKSTDFIRSLLLASFYYRPARNEAKNNVAIDRFLNLAMNIAEEIGISTADSVLSVASAPTPTSDISSSDAWRTWNLCFLLSTSLSNCMRIPSRIPWDDNLEMKLSSLEYGPDALSTDMLLCQLVRAEKLCQQISVEAGFDSSGLILEVTDYAKLQRMQNLVRERKAQTMSSMNYPSLDLYAHVAIMIIHECVLHTPTNILSFAAPYIAERLSLTDFPTPNVTEDHVSSLYKLRESCHNVLKTFLALEATSVASSPMIMLTTKAFYSVWLLVKLYIAITSPGNTYGAFIDVETLQLEFYLDRLAVLGDIISSVDSTFLTGQMLKSSRRLRDWVRNYDVLRAEENAAMPLRYLETDSYAVDSIDESAYQEVADFNIEFLGYDLDILFGTS